jgi:glycosyltransferase involved in cell wall biosynthesis
VKDDGKRRVAPAINGSVVEISSTEHSDKLDAQPIVSRASLLWHSVTGEYPPTGGGVADYTELLARSMAAAGQEFHVWTRGNGQTEYESSDGVTVHRVARQFGIAGLRQMSADLERFSRPRRLLVQYVPHAFSWKAMNLAFSIWVWWRRWISGDDVWVMFHEVAFPFVRSPPQHNLIAIANRIMATILLAGSNRVFVSTPAWIPLLQWYGSPRNIEWIPIPSNIPVFHDKTKVAAIRELLVSAELGMVVGHFGTYAPMITGLLDPVIGHLLVERPETTMLLLGRGAEAYRNALLVGNPAWSNRLVAVGDLSATDLSLHLQACDVLLQPYRDGASTRRTSLMAGLAHGVPTVTTIGAATEPIWMADRITPAVPLGNCRLLVDAVTALLDDSEERRRIGQYAQRYYEDHFSVQNVVARLLQ